MVLCHSRETATEGPIMIYAIAQFDWLGIECVARLGPGGWTVPQSAGVEAALNVVARLAPVDSESGSAVENALASVRRIFPKAVIERPAVVTTEVRGTPSSMGGPFAGPAHAVA
jgi:hypothetical protein